MGSSLSRQTASSLSIIPGQPLHRLTESMTKDLSVVDTSMVPALPTDSWLASQAHRRQMRRARKCRRSIPGGWLLHSIRHPRRGEVQCRRAELSVWGPAASALCDDARAWVENRHTKAVRDVAAPDGARLSHSAARHQAGRRGWQERVRLALPELRAAEHR